MKTIISSSALTDTKFIFIKGIIKVNHRVGGAHLVLVSLLLTDGIRYFRKSVLEHWAILHTYIHIYLFIYLFIYLLYITTIIILVIIIPPSRDKRLESG